MLKRVIGGEIEWATLQKKIGGWEAMDDFGIMPILRWAESETNCRQNQPPYCMSHGGTIYKEPAEGGTVETTTPECVSLKDLIIYEKWWEWFLFRGIIDIFRSSQIRLMLHKKNADFSGTVKLNPDGASVHFGLDFNRNTRGCHESYLIERKLMDEIVKSAPQVIYNANPPYEKFESHEVASSVNFLILFLITRQIISGAGGIKFIKKGQNGEVQPRFMISPRLLHLNRIFGSTTTDNTQRSIINTRDEPHTEHEKFGRLHLICGDGNMSEFSLFLKFGTTRAVLEMIEEGFWEEDSGLKLREVGDALRFMKQICFDLTCKKIQIPLTAGAIATAIAVQKRFCELFVRYLAKLRKAQPPDEHFKEKMKVAALWRKTLKDLEVDAPSLTRRLDWKIKWHWISKELAKTGIELDHPRIQALDLGYHNIDPEKGIYNKLVREGYVEHLLPKEIVSEIPQLGAKPPPNTRAKVRVELMARIKAASLNCSVNWEYITFYTNWSYPLVPTSYAIYYKDPSLTSVEDIPDEPSKNNLRLLSILESNPGYVPPHNPSPPPPNNDFVGDCCC